MRPNLTHRRRGGQWPVAGGAPVRPALAAIAIAAFSLAACGGHARDEAAAVPEPGCAEVPQGIACWREITGKPGCHVFDNPDHSDREFSWSGPPSVTWSGSCSGGIATGEGELIWKGAYRVGSGVEWSLSGTGELRRGVRHGPWVVRLSYGRADGKDSLDGLAADLAAGMVLPLWPWPDGGKIMEGSFEDGRKHGDWFFHYDHHDGGNCVHREYSHGRNIGNRFCAPWDRLRLGLLLLSHGRD